MVKRLLTISIFLLSTLSCQLATKITKAPSPVETLAIPVTGEDEASKPAFPGGDLPEQPGPEQSLPEPFAPSRPLPTDVPAARMWASLMEVAPSGQMLLFGGGRLVDTWLLDVAGSSWNYIPAANLPDLTRLGGVGAAYDHNAEKLIVFFYQGAGQPGETWSFDLQTKTWINLLPENQPPSRRFTNLVYHPQARKTILFGGTLGDDESTVTNELWAYDYPSNTWTQLEPEGSAPPVYFTHTVYDAAVDRLLVWGGKPLREENAVWAFDYAANRWTIQPYDAGPRQDYDGVLVHAEDTGLNYLYVGEQFWSYDARSGEWQKLASDGPGRQYAMSLAYSSASGQLVLFIEEEGSPAVWLYGQDTQLWTEMGE